MSMFNGDRADSAQPDRFTPVQARQFIARLKSFYGTEFNRKWADVAPQMLEETICASFRAVMPEQLAKCFRRISTSGRDFCPSIPTLLVWCFEGELLSDAAAYRMTGDEQISDPLVYEAARRIGFWELRHKHEAAMRPAFVEAYKGVKAEYMSGVRFVMPKQIAPPSLHVPESAAQKISRQALARAAIAQIRGQISSQTDNKISNMTLNKISHMTLHKSSNKNSNTMSCPKSSTINRSTFTLEYFR